MDDRELVLGPEYRCRATFYVSPQPRLAQSSQQARAHGVQVGQLQRTGVYGGINVCSGPPPMALSALRAASAAAEVTGSVEDAMARAEWLVGRLSESVRSVRSRRG
jgi:hypothetical protein